MRPIVCYSFAESRVKGRRVDRTDGLLLTDGAELGEHARQVLAGYEDAVRETGVADVRGELPVTAPLVFGRRHVTPIVTSFLDAWPGMRVERR